MRLRTIVGWGALAVVMLLVVALAVTAWRNRSLPSGSETPGELSAATLAHLAEGRRLLTVLGSRVWPATEGRPGWGDVPIPLITYNEAYVYLVMPEGITEAPSPGWARVPDLQQFGHAWEPVSGLDLASVSERTGGQIYRAPLPGDGVTPQGFTVQVGDLWASSLATQTWTRVMLYDQFQRDLPPFLRPIFPYRLAARLLLQGTDGYELFIVHEAFHAYQGSVAPDRLIEGERVQRTQEGRYPWDDEAFEAAWQEELDLLAEGVRAETVDEARVVALRFLDRRATRRANQRLAPALADYERQREWVEGLAKYSEVRMWQAAYEGLRASPPTYTPVAAVREDPEFRAYRTYPNRYRNEVAQITRTAGREGDGRFYYSGWAQADLLDRLMPEWQARVFDEGVFLEDLLQDAVASTAADASSTVDVSSIVDASNTVDGELQTP